MSIRKQKLPIQCLRVLGLLDGISLLVLLFIAMPLKYWAGMPLAVTIVGAIHGLIFTLYALSIAAAQLFIQWKLYWSVLAVAVAFIPFGNFVLDRYLKKREDSFLAKPIPLLWLVYSIIFFTFIDLFTQLPVMSTYAESLGASLTVAGFIVGAYSLANTGGNILAGNLTDRIGAFKVLAAGLIGTCLLLVSYSLVDSPAMLLVVRFVHGFIGGFIVPAAFTFVANQSKKNKEGSQNAVTGAFVGVAAIVGPAFSGIVAARTSAPTVFLIVAAAGAVLTVITFIFMRKLVFKKDAEQKSLPFVWNNQVGLSFAGAFLLMFSQGALAYLLPLRVGKFGYDSSFSGTLLSVFGLVVVCIFVLRTKNLFDRIAPQTGLMIGLLLLGVSQLLLGLIDDVRIYYGIMALYGIGFAFLFPSINVLLMRGTTKENRGKAYGYFYAFFSLGVVAGSSGLGLLQTTIETLFIVTSGLLLFGTLSMLLLKRTRDRGMHMSSPS
ncbi:MFS transporter [Paenibacillus septentrionalis]|uniref:MFS transporter n=1 Tax=Paenibacillus septentrionalis TaxID=429342 RepID=A0ABW1V708_9BACL